MVSRVVTWVYLRCVTNLPGGNSGNSGLRRSELAQTRGDQYDINMARAITEPMLRQPVIVKYYILTLHLQEKILELSCQQNICHSVFPHAIPTEHAAVGDVVGH